MKSYLIHLIRHAMTEGNYKGQYIGHTDQEISEQGMKELLDFKKNYTYPQADAFFSSPLKRCIKTLDVLYPNSKPIVMENLIEYNFGEFEQKTAEELKDNEQFAKWLSGDMSCAPPFGESNGAFVKRICETFTKIVEGLMKTGTTSSVICTHGGVIMALMTVYGLPEHQMWEWMVQNCCGYTVRITPGIWMRGQKMEVESVIPIKNKD